MSMSKYAKFVAIVNMVFCGLATVAQADSTAQQILDLSGTWSFQLDEQSIHLFPLSLLPMVRFNYCSYQ